MQQAPSVHACPPHEILGTRTRSPGGGVCPGAMVRTPVQGVAAPPLPGLGDVAHFQFLCLSLLFAFLSVQWAFALEQDIFAFHMQTPLFPSSSLTS